MDNGVWDVLLPLFFFLFIAGFFGLVGWIWWHGHKRDDRSDKQLQELIRFAEQRGWSYTASVPGGADRYAGGPPFPLESFNIPLTDCITGEFRGRTFSCFEYHAREMNTDGADTYRHWAVFAVTMPMSGPRLIVTGQGKVAKFNARLNARVFGGGEVLKLGDSAFDEAFLVTAHDERYARQVLTGQVAQLLTSDPRAQKAPLRFDGNELISWYWGRLRPERIDAKLNYLCDLLDRQQARA
ncbi:hypothetical protein [Streptomyces yunnanensis]|uniref:Uncharacterized protein n=1 Tax=Streptomyces yunnanensis TaxID=156453 RepID=A0A9X8MIE9_9ACTN|nr:hypothetical protein [Streptomyces yunnanensis]SHK73267.1 hypothetical protein SAMN05216268_101136 [Streptomyces yunnanensis]